jgi:hypothetical protein
MNNLLRVREESIKEEYNVRVQIGFVQESYPMRSLILLRSVQLTSVCGSQAYQHEYSVIQTTFRNIHHKTYVAVTRRMTNVNATMEDAWLWSA